MPRDNTIVPSVKAAIKAAFLHVRMKKGALKRLFIFINKEHMSLNQTKVVLY